MNMIVSNWEPQGSRWPAALAAAGALLALLALLAAPPHAAATPQLRASAISAGETSTCALPTSGQVSCWGGGLRRYGSPVTGVAGVTAISAGELTCAIGAGASVFCWDLDVERNRSGSDFRFPTAIRGLTDAIAITTGGARAIAGEIPAEQFFGCAIRGSGQAACWGGNFFGQLGDGTTTRRAVPAPVSGLADAVSISAGRLHACAIRASGQAVCWGANEYGQLGDGTTARRSAPVPVSGLTDAIAISAGNNHSCAIRTSGQTVCWGNNMGGELGDGTAGEELKLAPVPVSDLTDAIAISAGHHSCAIRASGQAVCWGDGMLGDGSSAGSSVPVAVSGLTDASQISVGNEHSCAVRASGESVCWGENSSDQLGDGTTTNRLVPTAVLTALAGPRLGVRATATLVSGRVRIRRPDGSGFLRLTGTDSIPFGSDVDARGGRVRILSAADRKGATREVEFYNGRFKLLQAKRPGAVTEARLTGPLANCGKGARGGAAARAAAKVKGRLVWGSGTGGHRSTGRNSSASVRGTRWLVWDRCDGSTLTRVAEGKVTVRDFLAKRTVIVRKGHSYVAGPR